MDVAPADEFGRAVRVRFPNGFNGTENDETNIVSLILSDLAGGNHPVENLLLRLFALNDLTPDVPALRLLGCESCFDSV
jgi:hypothetical protein